MQETLSYSQSIQDSLNQSHLSSLAFSPGTASNFQRVTEFQDMGWGVEAGGTVFCINMKAFLLVYCPGSTIQLLLRPQHSGRSRYADPLVYVTSVLFMKVHNELTSPLCHSGARGLSEPLSALTSTQSSFPDEFPPRGHMGNSGDWLPGVALYGRPNSWPQCPCS